MVVVRTFEPIKVNSLWLFYNQGDNITFLSFYNFWFHITKLTGFLSFVFTTFGSI